MPRSVFPPRRTWRLPRWGRGCAGWRRGEVSLIALLLTVGFTVAAVSFVVREGDRLLTFARGLGVPAAVDSALTDVVAARALAGGSAAYAMTYMQALASPPTGCAFEDGRTDAAVVLACTLGADADGLEFQVYALSVLRPDPVPDDSPLAFANDASAVAALDDLDDFGVRVVAVLYRDDRFNDAVLTQSRLFRRVCRRLVRYPPAAASHVAMVRTPTPGLAALGDVLPTDEDSVAALKLRVAGRASWAYARAELAAKDTLPGCTPDDVLVLGLR